MCNCDEVYPEIEEMLKPQLEGQVFEHLYLWTMAGSAEYGIHIDYYTVKDGKVYIIKDDGSLYYAEDTLLRLSNECYCLGKYDPAKKYKPVRQDYIRTLLKKKLGV